MRLILAICVLGFAVAIGPATIGPSPLQSPSQPDAPLAPQRAYLGFDRNIYPGDDILPILKRTFSFAGFWLNNPPGAASNSWTGKRSILAENGFGFLLLFNGRLDRELRRASDPAAFGSRDAQGAVANAKREGFQPGAVIFLDQEEGGRLFPRQLAYILAWADAVNSAAFRAGVYCSGMRAKESDGRSIITADDIRDHARAHSIVYFVYNDACPPAPGCAYPQNPPPPAASGVAYANVWQFAQSPRRREFTRSCKPTYNSDGNCYAPGPNLPAAIDVDLDSATSPDPSNGRQ